ncbi:trypsin-like serine peptidase [Wenjunlia tyrosinilytica]|uniref:trypsin-like serine peptidase n=1 Tax=Wenjunlia tyrosinilytica TaxID=1544741 RepID=UPI00166C24F7|nr:trypsin-like peptidase domain-containing protein [Wenjunlia tyrosinilytica]
MTSRSPRRLVIAATMTSGLLMAAGLAAASHVHSEELGSDGYRRPGQLAEAEPRRPAYPTAARVQGARTIGAVRYTARDSDHFCTASVVDSPHRNLLLTAAHCVYDSEDGPARGLAFTPMAEDGRTPLGVWKLGRVFVAQGWKDAEDEDEDFAFVTVEPLGGRNVQDVTGANRVAVDPGYTNQVRVIGYPNSSDSPIGCDVTGRRAMPHQMRFDCNGYSEGTSGSPWLRDYDARSGSGTVVGVLGGHQAGGDIHWTSYGAYPGRELDRVYSEAKRG